MAVYLGHPDRLKGSNNRLTHVPLSSARVSHHENVPTRLQQLPESRRHGYQLSHQTTTLRVINDWPRARLTNPNWHQTWLVICGEMVAKGIMWLMPLLCDIQVGSFFGNTCLLVEGLGSFSFSKAWRVVSGGERKLLSDHQWQQLRTTNIRPTDSYYLSNNDFLTSSGWSTGCPKKFLTKSSFKCNM